MVDQRGQHQHGPEGHPHAAEGHPHAAEGHPYRPEGHPYRPEGHPPGPEGHAREPGGHVHGPEGHASAHGGHAHGITSDADRRWLTVALALIGTYLVGEVIVGVLAGSLALLSDAAHMLTDAGAIVLALVAMRLAARPPRAGYTYGLKRAEILSALINGVTMLGLAAWLCVEAVLRLIDPPRVNGMAVLLTAAVGVVVNLMATRAIGRANRTSLNVRGAYLHVLTDLYAFLATGVAGLVMVTTGFTRADAIATLIVVALMLRAGAALVRECTMVFLEAAPAGVDPPALGGDLADVPGVAEVHDLHVWQITSGQPALSAHVMVSGDRDCHTVRADIESLLRERYGIGHSTVQVDHEPAEHRCEAHGESYRSAAG